MSYEALLILLLGWFLGLFSPLIVDLIKKFSQRKEILAGISIELIDLKSQLVSDLFGITFKYGDFNHDFLKWIQPHFKDFSERFRKNELMEVAEKLAEHSEGEFSQFSYDMKRKYGNRGLTLRKHHIPYTNLKVGNLTLFKSDLQRQIHEIRSQLDMLNEQIDESWFYFKMTYDSSLSPENHRKIYANLIGIYETIGGQCKKLINLISGVLDKIPKDNSTRIEDLIKYIKRVF